MIYVYVNDYLYIFEIYVFKSIFNNFLDFGYS